MGAVTFLLGVLLSTTAPQIDTERSTEWYGIALEALEELKSSIPPEVYQEHHAVWSQAATQKTPEVGWIIVLVNTLSALSVIALATWVALKVTDKESRPWHRIAAVFGLCAAVGLVLRQPVLNMIGTLSAAMAFYALSRRIFEYPKESTRAQRNMTVRRQLLFSAACWALVCIALAIYHESSWIGFCAAFSCLTLCGMLLVAQPGELSVIWMRRDDVESTALGSFCLMSIGLFAAITKDPNFSWMEPLVSGFVVIGSYGCLVGWIAISSYWFWEQWDPTERKHKVRIAPFFWRNLAIFILMSGMILFGTYHQQSVLELGGLVGLTGWGVLKLWEIAFIAKINRGWGLGISSAILLTAGWLFFNHKDTLQDIPNIVLEAMPQED